MIVRDYLFVPILVVAMVLAQVACASTSAVQDAPLRIHLYKDASVVVEGNASVPLYSVGAVAYGYGEMNGRISVKTNSFTLYVSGYDVDPSSPLPGRLTISVDYSNNPESGVRSEELEFAIEYTSLNGSLTRITGRFMGGFDPSNLTVSVDGTIIVRTSSGDLLDILGNLTLEDIQMLLGSAGVEVTKFSVERLAGGVILNIGLSVPISQDTQEGKSLVAALTQLDVPMTGSFSLAISGERASYNISLMVASDINAFIDSLYTVSESGLFKGWSAETSVSVNGVNGTEFAFTVRDLLELLHEHFYIQPSNGWFVLRYENGTGVLSFKSPRLLSRNVTEPTSTLKELYSVASRLSAKYPCVMTMSAVIEPADFKGTIALGGKPIRTIRISDLPRLSVTFAPSSSATAPAPLPPAVPPTVSGGGSNRSVSEMLTYAVIAVVIGAVAVFAVRGMKR